MFEEDRDEDYIDPNDMSGNGSQSPGDMMSDIDQNRKDLERFRKKKKGGKKSAEKKAEKKAAEHEAEKAGEKKFLAAMLARVSAKLAAGLATGVGLILAIPDLINFLKSKYGKWTMAGCCFCGCLPAILLIGFAALLTLAVLGAGGGDSNNACPAKEKDRPFLELPDLSVNVLSKDGEDAPHRFTSRDAANNPDGDNPCYVSAAKKAEEETNVPWEMLAAIDYRQYEHGEDDDKYKDKFTSLDALRDIGRDVQLANRLRDKTTGELILDKDGNTINTITPDINDKDGGNVSAALSIMSNYRCRYANYDVDTEGNETGPDFDTLSDAEKDQYCFGSTLSGPDCDISTGAGCCDLTTHKNCHSGADLIGSAWDDKWLTANIQDESLINQLGLQGVVDLMKKLPVIHLNLWLGGKLIDIADWAVSDGNYGFGAVTWYKIFMGLPDECYEEEDETPDGTSPVCNDPNITKPGEKALCAAQRVVEIGTPYEMGGPTTCYGNWAACPAIESIPNFDCSGLAGWAWYQAGVDIGGGGAASQYARISNHPPIESLEPGDLIFFGESYSCEYIINGKCSQHVAIYEGNNMVTHTYNYGTPPKMHHSLDEVKSWYSAGIIGTGRPE